MSPEETNTALVGRSRAGDADAFGSLVRQYAGRAIGTDTLMLGSHHDALDASQEAFVRAWRKIDRFRGDGSFYAWFSAILRNVCIDRIRRRAKRKHASLDDVFDLADTDDSPEVLADKSEQARKLWQAIRRLSPAHRDIIILSHFQEMSYRQIADALDIPIGTVMSRLHGARKALRGTLTGATP
jgi:RNA polymerase sigma-70 factor (ECF subfamily)